VAAAERDPAPALRPYVRRYDGWHEQARSPIRRREGPGGDVIILLSFGFDWRIGQATNPSQPWERQGSFVAGLHQTSVLTEHDGESYGIQISLTPPGAYALLGIPMHELAGRTVALDAVLWNRAPELTERLAGFDTWPERFELLDEVLTTRLKDVPPPSPSIAWAWQRLAEAHGCVSISDLTTELGWSRKRLAARFREQVGLAPKSLARILRFERAKVLLAGDHPPELARLALECGYYDQSHLSNEFRRISGTTPAACVASAFDETNLQDAVPPRS
jgi:AraC-like DNA-binding protein